MQLYLLVTLFLIVAFGAVFVWSNILGRLRRGAPVLPLEPRRPVPWTGGFVLLAAGIFLAAIVSGASVASVLNDAAPLSTLQRGAISFVFLSIAAIAVIVTLQKGFGATARDFGIPATGREFGRDVLLGVTAFFATAAPVYAIQFLLSQLVRYEHPLINELLREADWQTWLMAILAASVAAPLFEEFIFRLLFQGWLERLEMTPPEGARLGIHTGPDIESDDVAHGARPLDQPLRIEPGEEHPANPYVSPTAPPEPIEAEVVHEYRWQPIAGNLPGLAPVFISAFVFATMHMGQGLAPIPLFFLALVLGYMYHRTHRIVAPITLHLVFNTFSLTVLWLSLQVPDLAR